MHFLRHLHYKVCIDPTNINTGLFFVFSIDAYGHTPLHKACAKNNVNPDIIEFLLDKCNQSAAVKDFKGMLPLHWVVLRPKPLFETVFFLLGT